MFILTNSDRRSLIALSLIMALLQYSPAPVYILDEIDAALDLSHTQNIGTLFRTRFKGAQFIVVSLKEGLFTNANVLFKTRFRDGTSIVERTADRAGGGGERGGVDALDHGELERGTRVVDPVLLLQVERLEVVEEMSGSVGRVVGARRVWRCRQSDIGGHGGLRTELHGERGRGCGQKAMWVRRWERE